MKHERGAKKMKPVQEYNEVEAFYHGISQRNFENLLAEANGKVESIVLFGRVGSEVEYEEVQGAGFVYACNYENRENATPGAGAYSGVTLILGWNGQGSEDVVAKAGEILVPLSSYKVIGVVNE